MLKLSPVISSIYIVFQVPLESGVHVMSQVVVSICPGFGSRGTGPAAKASSAVDRIIVGKMIQENIRKCSLGVKESRF